MSQDFISDFNTTTQFSTFWQESENAFNALKSNFSGATLPTSTVAYMEAVDSDEDLKYMRNSGDTAWAVQSSMSDDRVISKTANYTILKQDFSKTILVDATSGDVTLTLPAAATAKDYWWCTIKRTDSSGNSVTIDGNSSETIDGDLTQLLPSQNLFMTVQCDGSNYQIINRTDTTSKPNLLLNSNFSFNQEGTSFSTTTSQYTVDLWKAFANSGGSTVAVTQQAFTAGQTDVPGNPDYYVNVAISGASTTVKSYLFHIENVKKLSGKTVTFSFYAKGASADPSAFKFYFKQNFGVSGSAEVETASSVQAITDGWKKYTYTVVIPSVSGKTIGAGNFTYVGIEMPIAYVGTISFATPKCEISDFATTWECENESTEYDKIARFYHNTYRDGVTPGSASSDTGHPNFIANAAGTACLAYAFPCAMRSIPTVTTYKPSDGTSGSFETAAQSGTYTASSVEVSEKCLGLVVSSGLTAGAGYQAHFVFDARF